MQQASTATDDILIYGLEPDLAEALERALERPFRRLLSIEEAPQNAAGVVFCPANKRAFESVRRTLPACRVIVVSRIPEVSDWLDLLEAGAADYCAAPFEKIHLRWILDTHLGTPVRRAAA